MFSNWSSFKAPPKKPYTLKEFCLDVVKFNGWFWRGRDCFFKAKQSPNEHPLKNIKVTWNLNMCETKIFKFKDLMFYKKNFDVSFNHFMFAVIGKSLKEKFKDCDAPYILATFPIDIRS